MANEEHLNILRQGVAVWNQWRQMTHKVRPDLSFAYLSEANLYEANLRSANLSEANLYRAYLSRADLSATDLSAANLNFAYLSEANLSEANLSRANLRIADLSAANLYAANLSAADLRAADLSRANLSAANLYQANLVTARCHSTMFNNVDLSGVKGLEGITHQGPSTIGLDTITKSQGKIPEVFLKGAGVPDVFITYMQSLTSEAIKFYSCFISYSSKDKNLAERLYNDLQAQGVRCWFAPEDLKWGAETRQGIDDAIRFHDKLLLILSKHSVESNWVQKEVETAFEEETLRKKQKQKKTTVLFPLRIDPAVMKSEYAWAADIRRMRNIGDFTKWKDHDAYQKAFERLLRDLKAEASNKA